jgi:hypothetical protein
LTSDETSKEIGECPKPLLEDEEAMDEEDFLPKEKDLNQESSLSFEGNYSLWYYGFLVKPEHNS